MKSIGKVNDVFLRKLEKIEIEDDRTEEVMKVAISAAIKTCMDERTRLAQEHDDLWEKILHEFGLTAGKPYSINHKTGEIVEMKCDNVECQDCMPKGAATH